MTIVSGDFASVNVLIHRQPTRWLVRSINVHITVPKRRVVGANAIVVVSAEKQRQILDRRIPPDLADSLHRLATINGRSSDSRR